MSKKNPFCGPNENPLFCERKKELKDALHFYRLAAAQGYSDALWRLGEIYQRGLYHCHSEPEFIVDDEEKESINKAARFYHLAMVMSDNKRFTQFDCYKIQKIYQGTDKNSINLNPTGRYHTLMTMYWYAVQSKNFNFASRNTLETGIHDLIENQLDENLLSAVLQQDPNPFLYSEEQKSVQIIIKTLKEKLYGLFVLMTDISLFPYVLGNLIFQYLYDIPIHANWIKFAENLEFKNSEASTSMVNNNWFFNQIKLMPSLQNGKEGVDKPNACINLDL